MYPASFTKKTYHGYLFNEHFQNDYISEGHGQCEQVPENVVVVELRELGASEMFSGCWVEFTDCILTSNDGLIWRWRKNSLSHRI